MEKKVVALVPIKLNSQRLPNKNILPIGGKPLCWYICKRLLEVKRIDEIYVYCSDKSVDRYLPKGIHIKERPQWMDGNEVKGSDIYEGFINSVDADVYVLAHTTSPFVKSTSISNALEKVLSGEYDSAFSATCYKTFAWYNKQPINYELKNVPRTQDIEPVWIETSAFYIFQKEIFTLKHQRIGANPYIQAVSGMEAVDIDEKSDYEMACKFVETLSQKGE